MVGEKRKLSHTLYPEAKRPKHTSEDKEDEYEDVPVDAVGVQDNILTQLHGFERDNRIKFQDNGHRYYIDWENNGKFTSKHSMSVTTVLGAFKAPFQKDIRIKKMVNGSSWPRKEYVWTFQSLSDLYCPSLPSTCHKAIQRFLPETKDGRIGRTRQPIWGIRYDPEDVADEWERRGLKARQEGTRFHAILENFGLEYFKLSLSVAHYLKNPPLSSPPKPDYLSDIQKQVIQIAEECISSIDKRYIAPFIQYLSFLNDHGYKYELYKFEHMMFTDNETRIVGSADLITVDLDKMQQAGNQSDVLYLVIFDYKLSKKLKGKAANGGFGFCRRPLNHLRSSTKINYQLQLSLYAVILETHYKNARWRGQVYSRIEVTGVALLAMHETFTQYYLHQLTVLRDEVDKILEFRKESLRRRRASMPEIQPFDPNGYRFTCPDKKFSIFASI
jgi:hypothetical protein